MAYQQQYAQDIKLTTTGTAISDAERNTSAGWDHSTGSILVEIQGEEYTVEDTKFNKIKNLHLGDNVIVCFELNDDDHISKISIID